MLQKKNKFKTALHVLRDLDIDVVPDICLLKRPTANCKLGLKGKYPKMIRLHNVEKGVPTSNENVIKFQKTNFITYSVFFSKLCSANV